MADNDNVVVYGPHGCWVWPVSFNYFSGVGNERAAMGRYCLSFASTLNVPESEDIWPGDATQLFFQKFFAMRLVGDDEVYCRPGPVREHMREEILRLCNSYPRSLEKCVEGQFKLDCYIRDGSFASEIYGDGNYDGLSYDQTVESMFCDGSDDEPEPDTLNSELLLTEEYVSPEKVNAPDASDAAASKPVTPRRRVNMFLPTERKD